MLELHINDTDVTNGTIPISWCVSKELLQALAADNVTEPAIIICIAPKNGYHVKKEHRVVVPLKDLMTYIEFRCAGENNIFGVVSYQGLKETRNRYLQRSDGYYHTDILDQDGEDLKSGIKYAEWRQDPEVNGLSKPISVTVPKECFAKEPPEWEKTWVNHFFRNKVVDQCDYRRRRMLAYSLQPILFIGYAAVQLLILTLSALFLFRGMSLKYLLHPLTYSFIDSLAPFTNGSYFIRSVKEDKDSEFPRQKDVPFKVIWYVMRKLALVPLMPIFIISIYVMSITHVLISMSLIFLCVATIFIFAGLVFTLFANSIPMKFLDWVIDKFTPVKPTGKWYLEKEEMSLLLCGENKKPMKISQLPSKHRTLKLRFYDLKSKVCRPFSR